MCFVSFMISIGDRAKDYKLISITKYLYGRLSLVVKLEHCWFVPTNQDFKTIFKVYETNKTI